MTECIVCGKRVSGWHVASWGPITLEYHDGDCLTTYNDRVAPRLRDALVHAIRRWQDTARSQRSTTDREPDDQ